MAPAAAVVFAALLAGAAALSAPPRAPTTVDAESAKKFRDLDAKRKAVSWHKQKVPARLHSAAAAARPQLVRAIPMVQRNGCGERVPASSLGLKNSPLAAKLFREESLLQVQSQGRLRGPADTHPGRDSLAKPGVGADQVKKDEGRSTIGKVAGKEPYISVLKDGWFEVGCYLDAMLEFGDKYGNNKFKYNMADNNVSVVMYSELVLKEKQKKMTPTKCFEFCRGLPGMVYFGITRGKDCYCAPYFKPMPGDNAQCDEPCEGDETNMCGNMAGKSSIWEMHLCADTANDLSMAMIAAKESLDFFFENAILANDLGTKMSLSAEKLEEQGGLAGSTTAPESARFANGASKFYNQAYMTGKDAYESLLLAYEDAKALDGKDFTLAEDTTKAERSITTMGPLTTEVLGLAAEIHSLNQMAYPLSDAVIFGDEPDSADAMATMLAKVMQADKDGKDTFKNINFRDVAYTTGTSVEPESSSCFGPTIGSPILGMGLAGCAAACEATVSPQNCKAFALYNVDGVTDLCVLLEQVEAAETFSCEGEAKGEGSPAGAKCMVKMSEIATGYKPAKEVEKLADRCFGAEKGFGVKEKMEELTLPEGTELKMGESTLFKAT